MRWDDSHESPDLIDRRGESRGGGGGGNLGLFYLVFWLLRRPWGWVVLLVLGVGYVVVHGVAALRGDDPRGLHGGQSARSSGVDRDAPEVHFVSFVLDDVQSTWTGVFAQRGSSYRHAKLVLFTDSTDTGCGEGSAATGPFYCPEDERVYLDVGFFHELSGKLGARGQFAQAYVIAHEVGHHVQKLLGTTERQRTTARGATGGSVRLELQADCFAGIWAHSTANGTCSKPETSTPRSARRGGRGGRSLATDGERHGEPRVVDSRLVGGAEAVVHARLRGGEDRSVRHLQRARAVIRRAGGAAAEETARGTRRLLR